MTQRVLIVRDCDVCEAEGRQTDAETHVVRLDESGDREVELCERHAAKVLAPLVAMLEAVAVRRPPEVNGTATVKRGPYKPRGSRTPTGDMPGMTAAAAAKVLGVTGTTVYQWIKAGRIESFVDHNGHHRLTEEVVAAYQAAHPAKV